MKLHPLTCSLIAALLLAPAAHAAKFTYHGDLMDGDAPAQGAVDLRVRSFADQQRQHPLGEATEVLGVALTQGSFNAQFDLPEDADGVGWIEVAVRKSATGGDYVPLGEAQPMPMANSTCPGAWALDGNSGAPVGSFLGFVDDNPLVLKAKNSIVGTFTPRGTTLQFGDAPSVALGSSVNVASGIGSTVSGGGSTLRSGGTACPACKNTASGNYSTVGGGTGNLSEGDSTTVGGGDRNAAAGGGGTVSGGFFNGAIGSASTVSGGSVNSAHDLAVTVGGGEYNRAFGDYSAISGGNYNTTAGIGSMVSGGINNCAGGATSWAGGSRAKVRPGTGHGNQYYGCSGVSDSGDATGDEGTFAWADNQEANFVSTGPNQFLIRANGGVGINAAPKNSDVELTITSNASGVDAANLWLKQRAATTNAGILLSSSDATSLNDAAFTIAHYNGVSSFSRMALASSGAVTIRSNITGTNTGVTMAANAGAWSSLSDRRLKTAIVAVDARAVLDRLLNMPMATWSYIAQGEGIRHIGPMAQDFAAHFGVGENDTTISTIDADGVALAAIQGLNEKLEDGLHEALAKAREENATLRASFDALAARLAKLEASQGE